MEGEDRGGYGIFNDARATSESEGSNAVESKMCREETLHNTLNFYHCFAS